MLSDIHPPRRVNGVASLAIAVTAHHLHGIYTSGRGECKSG